MSTERRLERILEAFADAVEAGEFEKAEGWMAVARFVQARAETLEMAPARGRFAQAVVRRPRA
jgi:hypothetical protein